MKIAVSACLLGHPCRYDGASKPCEKVIALQKEHSLIPICPEVMGGLPTPRTPCEICGDLVLTQKGEDRTAEYEKGALAALELYRKEDCELAILKTKSPSCGKGLIYDGSFSKKQIKGNGITATLFLREGIPVYTEEDSV